MTFTEEEAGVDGRCDDLNCEEPLKGLPDRVNAVFPRGDRADAYHPPDPQHLPARQEVLGPGQS